MAVEFNGKKIALNAKIESTGGGGGSSAKEYLHMVSFDLYSTTDSDIGGWATLTIFNHSETPIVGTDIAALKTFLSNIGTSVGNFYPISIRTNGYTSMFHSGIYEKNGEFHLSGMSSGETDLTVTLSNVKEIITEM